MMKKKHQEDADLSELCRSPRPDDGVDPKVMARRKSKRRSKPGHHQLQLCKQVRQAIDASILCDCGDPIFDHLGPCQVTPYGRGNELLVTFKVTGIDHHTIEELHARLESVKGLLRTSVAEAIHRKRVPGLQIQVVPTA